METVRQSFRPKIVVSHYDAETKKYGGSGDIVFSPSETDRRTLLSYSFENSVDNFAGSFSFSFKEDYGSGGAVMDRLEALDLVRIYESDRLRFIGILTDVSFSAASGNVQKKVSASGKSAEYLFEILQVSLDVTALAGAGKGENTGLNLSFVTEVNKEQGEKRTTVKDGVCAAYESFKTMFGPDAYGDISSVQVMDMVNDVYGSDMADFLETGDLEFHYPISGQLYQNKTVRFFDFVRNLLPSPVYERHLEAAFPRLYDFY